MSKTYVAVTQAEPVWLDLEATTDKTCALISEAAGNGAQLVAFPEYWLPGYPAWIWSRPIDFDLSIRYIQNSMKLESPEMSRIRQCAAHNQIVVVLGFAENINESLYISQAIIGSDGRLLRARKKMKPTHMERTIFGDSFGDCLSSVAETVIGRVGALSCWEHIQPLLKYHTCSQREKIHVAAWPPLFEEGAHNSLYSMSSQGTEAIAQTYVIESQSFVLHTTSVLTQHGINLMNTAGAPIMNVPGGGSSAIFAPDGRRLTAKLPSSEQGILYAMLDPEEILKARAFVDVCGHYSRPDLLWLGVETDIKVHVREDTKKTVS